MTIREIAKIAGVAPSTVSLTLNGKPGVRKDKRDRIAALLIENGYEIRSPEISAPAGGEIKFLRYLAENHSRERNEDFFVGLLNGAEPKAHKLGYNFSLSSVTPSQFAPVLAALEMQQNLVGVILIACELTADQIPHILSFSKPLVTLDMPLELERYGINGINTDNTGGIFSALEYLYNLGHRSIGFLRSETEIGGLYSRYLSYRKAMDAFGLEICENHILRIDPRYEIAIMQMEAHLKHLKTLPTAFIAGNDTIAAGAVRALRRNGYAVPKDVSVIGFDNGAMSTFVSPSLTTLGINRTRMGELAVERIIALNENPNDVVVRSIMSVNLIARESTTFIK